MKENYLKIDIELNNWKVYKRLVKAGLDANIDKILEGLKRDVFVEPTIEELNSVSSIYIENLWTEVLEEIRNEKDRIFLIVDSDNVVLRPLIWIKY